MVLKNREKDSFEGINKKEPKHNISNQNKFSSNNNNNNNNNRVRIFYSLSLFFGLLFLILFFMFQIQIYNQEFNLEHSATEFSNVIQLLAVSEDENGNITSASQIPLHLTIIEGSGEIFVNLNSYTEIDTQISITNSNEVICTLLELSCNNYDFYYSFEDASLVLRGPSASTSIAVLTYATVNGIILDDSFALTGALNSNGIIGNT